MTGDGGDGGDVEVMVKLAPHAMLAGSPGHAAVQVLADRLAVALAPLHPSTGDPELASWAVAHIPPGTATVVVEEFLACGEVEAAYVKPRGEPPERSIHA